MAPPRLTITCSDTAAGISCASTLQHNHHEWIKSAEKYPVPVTAADQLDIQWLLEERVQLRGAAATRIADRIETRVRNIGYLLGEIGCGSSDIGKRIAEVLRNEADSLEVRIEQRSARWIPWSPRLPGLELPLSCVAVMLVRSAASELGTQSDNGRLLESCFCRATGGGRRSLSISGWASSDGTAGSGEDRHSNGCSSSTDL
jgi:hypothetical protein